MNQLKQFRKKYGLTQTQLVEKLKIRKLRSIQGYETGKRKIPPEVIFRLEQIESEFTNKT